MGLLSISQELHPFDMANGRHNMKVISSAFFSLANVWLANPIKIWRVEARVGIVVNVGYVSHDQMPWIVINGLIGVPEVSYIFDFIFNSQLLQV